MGPLCDDLVPRSNYKPEILFHLPRRDWCLQPLLSSLEKQVSVKATYYYYPQEESQEQSAEFPPLAPSRAQAYRAAGFSQEPGPANSQGVGGKAFNLMAPVLWGPREYPSLDSCQTSLQWSPTLGIDRLPRGIWSFIKLHVQDGVAPQGSHFLSKSNLCWFPVSRHLRFCKVTSPVPTRRLAMLHVFQKYMDMLVPISPRPWMLHPVSTSG